MAIVWKTGHLQEALDLLANAKGLPNVEAILQSIITQVQELEDAAKGLYELRGLYTATGAQLDVLGSIVGQDRLSFDDETYRALIGARIWINVGNGTINDVIGAIRTVFGGSVEVELTEDYPANFVAVVNDPVPATPDPAVVGAIALRAKAAGVGAILEYHSEGAFTYDIGPGYDVGLYGGTVTA